MTVPVKVIAKPVDDSRCTLLLSREAGDAPVAQAVLGVSGIVGVVVAGAELTVTKGGASPPWSDLVAQLRYAVRTAMEQPDAAPGMAAATGPVDDDTVYQVADRVCRTEINSWVSQHGGNVEMVDVQDGVVVLRLSGGCQGCGMARVTLSQGIETALRRAIPSLRGVRDVTDHDAGTRPYFRQTGE
jgi:Fe-S cluster biogenesis protein NfuA